MDSIRLHQLPSEILQHICLQLDSVDDVFSLQETHPRIDSAVNATFWRLPRVLCLGSDSPKPRGASTIRLLVQGQRPLHLPNDVETLRVVLERATLLRELQLERHIGLSPRDQKYALELLRTSGTRLKYISACFANPEAMSAAVEPDSCWPSYSVRKRFAHLVSSQRNTLQYLCIRFGAEKFVRFERNASRSDLSVHIAFQNEVNVFLQTLYPIATAFNHHSISPKSVAIVVDVDDSRAHRALQDGMHTLSPAQRDGIRDLRVHMPRLASPSSFRAIVDSFEAYLTQLGSLRSLSWHFTDATHVDELKSCLVKTNLREMPKYATFVSTVQPRAPFNRGALFPQPALLVKCV